MVSSLFDLTALGLDGNMVELRQYDQQVLLIVNTASKCGFTSQYATLEQLYQRYKDRGFSILGFPSNDYMWQEPGSDSDIQQFCTLNFGVTFPMFSKGKVKGSDKQPVYKFLCEQASEQYRGDPGWNFVKFLIDRKGQVAGRYSSMTKPDAKELVARIEELLI